MIDVEDLAYTSSTDTQRLICFHHAGGASAAFRPLIRALGPHIPITAVNLPGRESRSRESRHRDIYACAAQLADG